MRHQLRVASIILLLLMAFDRAWGSPIVDDGYLPNATYEGAVRYRDFNNDYIGGSIYLGIDGLGIGASRVEKTFYRGTDIYGNTPYGTWLLSPDVNHVEFIYDKPGDRLITNVTASNSYQLIYDNFSAHMPNPANLNQLNYLQIEVVCRKDAPGSAVAFDDVMLDGNSLGNFVAPYFNWRDWHVTNYDFSNGFSLSGDILLTGAQADATKEYNKVELKFGNVPEPSAVAGLLGLVGMGLFAYVWQRRKKA